MGQYYISQEKFLTFLDNLTDAYSVFIPVKKGTTRFYTQYEASSQPEKREHQFSNSSPVVGEVRTYEPIKAFFFNARQKVAVGFQDDLPGLPEKPFCIVGAKACDLHGLKILDTVFISEDYTDPFYEKARQDTLIISADCTLALDTCYCLSFHNEPYPQESFDVNLSEVDGGYIVEEGSQKGAALISQNASLFSPPDSQSLARREEQRKRVRKEVEEKIQLSNTPEEEMLQGVIERNYEAPIWEEEAQTCVECAACNMICPTCHCFLLYDQKKEDAMARFRIWDSCMLKNFARVAGGANPRKFLWMRLRNRFEKKFDFFPKVFNIIACTGCGRCISACPAKIDIRRVLSRLVENVQQS
jgi:sulfhydrogenase subunit beta (sulfur reductase)